MAYPLLQKTFIDDTLLRGVHTQYTIANYSMDTWIMYCCIPDKNAASSNAQTTAIGNERDYTDWSISTFSMSSWLAVMLPATVPNIKSVSARTAAESYTV